MRSILRNLFAGLALAAGALMAPVVAIGQDVALKTNLLTDVTLNPNLGVEIGLAPKWTLDLTGQVNFWTVDGHKWKHWVVQPEARYWFCQRFGGHFLGFHAIGGQYNFGNIGIKQNFLGSDFSNLRHMRYQGWAAGAGVAYGYAWPVARHWNVEAEVGVGWLYTRYDSFPCVGCGRKIDENKTHNYVGPTKAALNIVYLF